MRVPVTAFAGGIVCDDGTLWGLNEGVWVQIAAPLPGSRAAEDVSAIREVVAHVDARIAGIEPRLLSDDHRAVLDELAAIEGDAENEGEDE